MEIEKVKERGGYRLEEAIQAVTTMPNIFRNYSFDFTLHTQFDDLVLDKIVAYERMRDYVNNVGDYILLSFKINLGTYVKRIYPERDYLMCTVNKKYATSSVKPINDQYKAVIVNDDGKTENLAALQTMTEADLNKDGLIDVELQLYPIEIEAFKQKFIEGIYKESTVTNLIGGLFAVNAKDIKLNGKEMDFKINMYPASNPTSYDNIILPSGLPLVNLPAYLQSTSYGVYNGDCGMYYQRYAGLNCLWIYPIYSRDRFEKEKDYIKLIIYKATNTRYDVVENSYSLMNNNLEVIGSTKSKLGERSVNNIMNRGDSYVTPNNAFLLNRDMEVTDDEVIYDSSKYLSGVKAVIRPDAMLKAQFIPSTPNMYKARSDLIKGLMATVQVPWHFSNDEMVYPGMPVQYVTEDSIYGTRMQEGTLLSIFTRYDGELKTTSSMLLVAVRSLAAFTPAPKEE